MNPIEALLNSDAGLAVVIPIALGLLTLIVFVHEFGHFVFARRFGVGVKEVRHRVSAAHLVTRPRRAFHHGRRGRNAATPSGRWLSTAHVAA